SDRRPDIKFLCTKPMVFRSRHAEIYQFQSGSKQLWFKHDSGNRAFGRSYHTPLRVKLKSNILTNTKAMKYNHIRKSIYLLTAVLVMFTGCKKDFLDINTDPINPTEVEISTLLPRAEQYAAFSMGFSRGSVEVGLSEVLAVYTHQMVLREDPDQYGANGTEFNLSGAWDSFYSNALPDLEAIIQQGTETDNMQYVGIAKILKAYVFSEFVDTYGDIPFSEASKFSEGITYPKFDNDEEIYPQLIAMLDEGIANLNADAANSLVPGE